MRILYSLLLWALLIASVITPAVLFYHGKGKTNTVENDVRQQGLKLAVVTVENERLNQIAAGLKQAKSLPDGQFEELLRLRGEIGPLRQAAAETDKLRADLKRQESGKASSQNTPPPPPALDIWKRGQLAFAGYTSPESTLKTAFWAITSGNMERLLHSVTPEAQRAFTKEQEKDGRSQAEATEGFKSLSDTFNQSEGFRLTAKKVVDPDRVILNVYFDGERTTRKFALRKDKGEWRMSDIRAASEDDDMRF